MAKISILVPVYNVEQYLAECLNSLINQTLIDIEIICINDGSTDASLKILKEYQNKDSRIIIIDKQNTGYGHSMNTGLLKAQGEYIGIVEPDDFVEFNMFENLYKLAIENCAEIVKSDFYYYNNDTHKHTKSCKIAKELDNKLMNISQNVNILRIVPSIWTSIYKTEFLQNNRIKFLETKGASYQDTSFAFKCIALAQKIFFTTKEYYYYRTDNLSASSLQKDKVFAICEEYKEIENFLEQNQKIKSIAHTTMLINKFKAYRWNARRIDNQYRDNFIEHFKAEFTQYYQQNQILPEFFNAIKKEEFDILINEPTSSFLLYLDKKEARDNRKSKRRKNYSIRINASGIRVVLFSKKLLDIKF